MTDDNAQQAPLPTGKAALLDTETQARIAAAHRAHHRAHMDRLAAQGEMPETAGRYQGRRREPVTPIAPDYVDDPTATASQMIRPYVLPDNRTQLPETYVLALEVTGAQWAWLDELMAYAIQRADQGRAPADGREVRALYYSWCAQVLRAEREYAAVSAAAAAGPPVVVTYGVQEYESPESVWEAEPESETFGWYDLWEALGVPDSDMSAVQSWSNLGPGERMNRSDLDTMVAAWHAGLAAWHADQSGPDQQRDEMADPVPTWRCDGCGRWTVDRDNFGKTCGMTQPDGARCAGVFGA